ncbi:hypothetical protein LTR36_003552 [Oleoguttula mirabilis]|uniref:DUF7730 domain-containing protein n=1 Tax=Oleoguttula mirabilis TaxID=1507867 RepID=A0AAV9JJI9_9PEZI|nr:hypothetical protein LTR36_003552 [Oleoguttula mirabilis]
MAKRKAADAEASAAPNDQPQKKKIRRRPMKVLAAKAVSTSNQDLYDANAQNSPLLRLPPEVRNRIWYFLLCDGETIHVRGRTKQGRPVVKYSICSAVTNDEDTAMAIRAHNGNGEEGDPSCDTYQARHSKCFSHLRAESTPREHRLSLSVLAVSRQIHQEAALLPYQGNTFSIDALEYLGPFLKALVPAQANAIEKMTLASDHGYRNSTFQKLLGTKLKGLRGLICFGEFYHGVHDGSAYLPGGIGGLFVRYWTEGLQQFMGLPIAKVVVAISSSDVSQSKDDALNNSYTTVQRLAKRLEEQLLA